MACAAIVGACVSGCQFTGIGSMSLPLTSGTGSGSYTVTADMSDVTNLPPNAEVMVNDVTVGTVTAVRFSNWHAILTISLPDSVKLPKNATATIGQKSLLGAQYVALAPPPKPSGQLTDGDVIPMSRTSAYPTTEDVLASLSTLLNGGGLNQLSTITRELNSALGGHEEQYRQLLTNLSSFTATLNEQKTAIVSTLSSVNTLSARIRSQNQTLTNAIDGIPGGLAVLNKNEANLTQALAAVSNLSTVADRVINESSSNLLGNLRNLQPALTQLADSTTNLVYSLKVLATFPFPVSAVLNSTRGDYSNVYIILDLTLPTLADSWLSGTLGTNGTTDKPATKKNNPVTNPLQGLLPGSSSSGGSSSSNGSSSSSPNPAPSSSPSSGSGGGLGGILGGILGG
jgi:phospholipid/cholesterol/gamma-HCH transport system substrate-binding protein